MKKTLSVVVMASLVVVILLCSFIAYQTREAEAVNGLNGEAGVILPSGRKIVLNTKRHPLAVFTVNSVSDLPEDTIIYWRFWLNLKATGISGRLVSVRFKLWQEINGQPSNWMAGTEGVSENIPPTSPTEEWFQVELPKDVVVKVPIKYRDAFWETEPPIYAPYSELSEDGTHVIREARMDQLGQMLAGAPDGYTMTWTLYCTIVEIRWEWEEAGVTKTGVIKPEPSEISYTFVITKHEAGLDVTLESEASH